jgi:hypothetical protein
MNSFKILVEIVVVLCCTDELLASSPSSVCSKAVVLDVDGVLCRGRKGMHDDGCLKLRTFHGHLS